MQTGRLLTRSRADVTTTFDAGHYKMQDAEAILKGLNNSAQGCESASYPGIVSENAHNPEGVAEKPPRSCRCNPVGVVKHFGDLTQGSSRTRNPGLNYRIPSGFTPFMTSCSTFLPWLRSPVYFAMLALSLVLCGCTPPGPRALLKGQRLIGQGKYEQAVPVLQEATRLLPKTAQAYNHLGLALHGTKQFAPALAAYKKALALDHKLAAAHYNLGCLYLEQNDPASATEELTSYTLLQSGSVDGWLKLGNAQLRAHRLDAAEKAFKSALALQPHHPEVLNGLGIIQLQRKRPQEALNYF